MASPLGCKEAIALLFSTLETELESAGGVSSDDAAKMTPPPKSLLKVAFLSIRELSPIPEST